MPSAFAWLIALTTAGARTLVAVGAVVVVAVAAGAATDATTAAQAIARAPIFSMVFT